ncbi:MAG TPA: hypothetical protein VJ734_05440 [Nitrosospira sp.]|nr:hypothetical protein [Nitrosospira sp.]
MTTGVDAVFHVAQLLAASGAGVANFRTDPAYLVAVARTAQHEICRHLADLGAIHHKAEVIGFYMSAT